MAKVTLDRDTFKALASETRLDLLRKLDERRKTGTELARELELNKATVHEHLQVLSAVGLVRKGDEGRKWVYWELSWQGRKLLHPEQGASFAVLLGLSILSGGGAIATLLRAYDVWGPTGGSSDAGAPEELAMADSAPAERDADGTEADASAEPEGSAPPSDEEAKDGGEMETGLVMDEAMDDSAVGADGGFGFTIPIVLFAATALLLLLAAVIRFRYERKS